MKLASFVVCMSSVFSMYSWKYKSGVLTSFSYVSVVLSPDRTGNYIQSLLYENKVPIFLCTLSGCQAAELSTLHRPPIHQSTARNLE